MESTFEFMERNGSLAPLPAGRLLDPRREGLNGYGPTGTDLESALERARVGDTLPLSRLLGVDPGDPRCLALRRARVRVDASTVGALLLRAERQVAAMLVDVRSAAD